MPFYYVKNRIEEIAKIVNELEPKEVLDLGGGNKTQGDLRKFLKPKIKYHCVDLENADIIYNLNKSFKFKTECIVTGEIIEHLIDPRHFLQCCYNSLKDSGHLIITTQNFGFWRFRLQALCGRVPDCIRWIKLDPSQHMHIFDWETFQQILEEERFKIIREVKLIKFPFFRSFQPNIFYVCRKAHV